MKSMFHESWSTRIDREMKVATDRHGLMTGFPGIVEWVESRGGRFAGWDKTFSPEGIAGDDLASAVELGCVMPNHPFYRIFLAWSNSVANRALDDPRFNIDPEEEIGVIGWKVKGVYPGNHGKTVVLASLTQAMRDNAETDDLTLLRASNEIAESALAGGAKSWDYISQSDYLRCVRLCLVAGSVQGARNFLDGTRRKFKHTSLHHEWLKTLCDSISDASDGLLKSVAVKQFDSFFDRVRDPEFQLSGNLPGGDNLFANLSILRLELAIIKQRFILARPIAGNWNQVLGLISE